MMRTYKTFFEENYTAEKVPCGNKRGYKIKYRYIGALYSWDIEKCRYIKIQYAFMGLLLLIFYLLCGTRRVQVNYALTVETGVLLSIIPLMFELIGIFQFCMYKELPEFTFKEVMTGLKIMPWIHAMLCGTAVMMGVVYIIKWNCSIDSKKVVFAYLCCAVISIYIGLSFSRLKYKREYAPKHKWKEDTNE